VRPEPELSAGSTPTRPRNHRWKVGPAPVDVDHPRLDADVRQAGGAEQRVQPPADQRVAAGGGLELHLRVDRGARRGALGVEVGRAVIALDHGHGAARPDDAGERGERGHRVRQVLEHEA